MKTSPSPASRRDFLSGAVALAASARCTAALAADASAPAPIPALDGVSLVTRPRRVFKTKDRSHENTETWIFSIFVQTDAAVEVQPQAATTPSSITGPENSA